MIQAIIRYNKTYYVVIADNLKEIKNALHKKARIIGVEELPEPVISDISEDFINRIIEDVNLSC